jgi:hypothetical protein
MYVVVQHVLMVPWSTSLMYVLHHSSPICAVRSSSSFNTRPGTNHDRAPMPQQHVVHLVVVVVWYMVKNVHNYVTNLASWYDIVVFPARCFLPCCTTDSVPLTN